MRLVREVADLRRSWQGVRHWQAIDAGYEIERWVWLARLSEADQKEVARALQREAEAEHFAARYRYAEAETAYRDVLAIHKKLLGEQHPDTAGSYNHVGLNLYLHGRRREAVGAWQAALLGLVAAVKTTPKGEAVFWREGKERTVALASPFGVQLDKRPSGEAVRAWRTQNEPVLRSASYLALPGTRYEVQMLQRLLGKRCRTLLGSHASEQQLDQLARSGELKRFRVLHLATHGKIDLDNPALSALILARDRLPTADEQADLASKGQKFYTGELRVGTILKDWKAKLDCDLVVLSACETALGRKSSGQGLLGFAYALQTAGARSVVLSRWKVSDDATALLMLRFYETLLGRRKDLKQPLGRAAALDEARKWLRTLPRQEADPLVASLTHGEIRGTVGDAPTKKLGAKAKLPAGERPYEHPAYWAAFTLLGDPD